MPTQQTFETVVPSEPMAPPLVVAKGRVIGLALVSAALHVTGLAGLLLAFDSDGNGAGGTDRDATHIEITLISANALDTQQHSRVEAPASGGVAAPLAPQVAEVETATVEVPALALPRSEVPQELQPPVIEPAPIKDPPPALEPVKDINEPAIAPPEPPPPRASIEQPPPTPSSIGGVESVGPALAAPPAPAAAATAPGTAERYARIVAENLGRQRPRKLKSGQRGTVIVTFMVRANGSVADARVSSSSGLTELDAAVLATVVAIAFAPPPQGLSAPQRTFVVPYRIH